jgi:hypothetical protein
LMLRRKDKIGVMEEEESSTKNLPAWDAESRWLETERLRSDVPLRYIF